MTWSDSEPEVRLTLLSNGWTFLVGAAIGVLITGIVWLAMAGFGGTDQPSTASDHGAALSAGRPPQDALTPAATGDTSDSPSPTAEPTLAQQCGDMFRAQVPVRQAAAASLEQWDVHVQAMNKLVAGEITWDQANAFWNQTRVGAEQRLATYDATRRTLDRQSARCPMNRMDEADPAAMTCMHAVAARDTELRKAETAVETWRHHVHHMEMLRMGDMSPAQATRLWLRSWKLGARQLDAYHAAALRSHGQHC